MMEIYEDTGTIKFFDGVLVPGVGRGSGDGEAMLDGDGYSLGKGDGQGIKSGSGCGDGDGEILYAEGQYEDCGWGHGEAIGHGE